jgi:hypothetical protein
LYPSAAGYELDGQPGDTIALGRHLEEIICNLRKNYARLIKLYSPFVRRLADDGNNVMNRLKRPPKSPGREPQGLLTQLGPDVPARLQEIAAALLPYVRRQPRGRRTVAQTPEADDSPPG